MTLSCPRASWASVCLATSLKNRFCGVHMVCGSDLWYMYVAMKPVRSIAEGGPE